MKLRHVLGFLSLVAVLIGVLNFCAVWSEAARIDRGSVTSSGGSNVLPSRESKEVDEAARVELRRRERSLIVTHPLAMLGMMYLAFQFIFPALIYRGSVEARDAGAKRIRESGPVLAQVHGGGRLGLLNLTYPLLHIAVHPKGLWIKPIFMAPIGIAPDQIMRVDQRRGWSTKILEVAHTSSYVATPMHLYASTNPAIEAQLQRFVRENGLGPGQRIS